MTEPHDIRLKRLTMRSMRRGIKEMDIILGGFADTDLAHLSPSDLDIYEQLLSENDHDLYAWCTGAQPTPEVYSDLMGQIAKRAHQVINV